VVHADPFRSVHKVGERAHPGELRRSHEKYLVDPIERVAHVSGFSKSNETLEATSQRIPGARRISARRANGFVRGSERGDDARPDGARRAGDENGR